MVDSEIDWSCVCLQGIDLIAGGKSKKTKRTAPKSDDVYLKLTVKVRNLNINLGPFPFVPIDEVFSI